MYIIDCLRKNKRYSNKEFLKIIQTKTGNLKPYKIYLDVKDKNKSKSTISFKKANTLIDFVLKRLNNIEKWLKEKKIAKQIKGFDEQIKILTEKLIKINPKNS